MPLILKNCRVSYLGNTEIINGTFDWTPFDEEVIKKNVYKDTLVYHLDKFRFSRDVVSAVIPFEPYDVSFNINWIDLYKALNHSGSSRTYIGDNAILWLNDDLDQEIHAIADDEPLTYVVETAGIDKNTTVVLSNLELPVDAKPFEVTIQNAYTVDVVLRVEENYIDDPSSKFLEYDVYPESYRVPKVSVNAYMEEWPE